MDILISYHRVLVEILLGAIFLNIFIVYSTKNNFEKTIKWSRIGYFIFWAIWAMVVFSGLIVFVFMKQKLNLAIDTMILASIALPLLDGYRAIKVAKIWQEGKVAFTLALKILLLEVAAVTAVTILAIVK
jgi:hypothetical protein